MCSTLTVCASSNRDRQTRYLRIRRWILSGSLRGFQGVPGKMRGSCVSLYFNLHAIIQAKQHKKGEKKKKKFLIRGFTLTTIIFPCAMQTIQQTNAKSTVETPPCRPREASLIKLGFAV